jgi:hypothetical protein
MKTNKWGPFFEDISGWSDTQINAITFARFIMEHREFFPEGKIEIKKIFTWVYKNLSNDKWKLYGVTPVNEQTAYMVAGNSHTSRQAAAQLQYMSLTGDSGYYVPSLRQLAWATYMVDDDGKNRYPQDENWLTDGYGDYVRHYLRAMAANPSLTPPETHLLYSSSVVQQAIYRGQFYQYHFLDIKDTSDILLRYKVFDETGEEMIRMDSKPRGIFLGNSLLPVKNTDVEWRPLRVGGVLTIRRNNSKTVTITR